MRQTEPTEVSLDPGKSELTRVAQRSMLYDPAFHNSVELDDGHGKVRVDAAIHPILSDLQALPFVKESISSCSGGSGDGTGAQRGLSLYEDGVHAPPGGGSYRTWHAYLAFSLDLRDPDKLSGARDFLSELARVKVQAETGQGPVEARVLLSNAPGQISPRNPIEQLSIVYDRDVALSALPGITDAAWSEVHAVIAAFKARR